MSDAYSFGFNKVWSDELNALGVPDPGHSAKRRAGAVPLFGVALSGGGIRSATFNLGMLQALAAKKLLGCAHYLSINSGGGYIGGWLLAWIRRQGIDRVQRELARVPGADPAADADDTPEARPVSFLRGFSNYLTPKVGLFSADTWMVVATYTRNLILNLTILIAALSALLLVPRAVLVFSEYLDGLKKPWLLLGAGALLLAAGAFTTGLNTFRLWAKEQPKYATQGFIQQTVVLPLFAAAWIGGLGARLSDKQDWEWVPDFLSLPAWWPAEAGWNWVLIPALLYLIPWLVLRVGAGLFAGKAERSALAPNRARMWRAALWSAPAAGAIGGLMLWGINSLAEVTWQEFGFEQSLIHLSVWGAPLLVGVIVLTAVFHIGLIGRAFSEHERQWWSRLGAWLLIYGVAWLGLFGAVFYGPVIIIWLGALLAGVLSIGWLMTTIGGVLAGKGQQSGDQNGMMRKLLAAAAPSVFVIGLLLLLATGLHGALDKLAGTAPLPTQVSGQPAALCQNFWPAPRAADDESKGPHPSDLRVIADCHAARIWVATDRYVVVYVLVLLAIAIWFSSRVDINAFSMHLFYRSRLIRAYLGASNPKRDANKFTGFDPHDDLKLAELQRRGDDPDNQYDGPYPILNAALNLVAGDELAWQERKAASFVFTPKYSGFRTRGDVDPQRAADENLERFGFRETARYDDDRGISLGTAMAISGAAISPSMGAQSSAAMAFLLTVFNVRLGWWLGNPRRPGTALRLGPRVGLDQLLDELFGQTNERCDYVYLSDGGHFENLALYELVRRRCRFIIVSDAGADPKMIFGDLGNAVRKCRTDFGIDIEFGYELDNLRRAEDSRFSRRHCAIGTIHYERADPGAGPGILLYIKASLNRDEPEDVQNYAASNKDFPHEATVDQWFSESQFESYRALGKHIGDTVLAAAREGQGIAELFAELERIWRSQPSAP